MSRARELCVNSARHHGVQIVHEYEPGDTRALLLKHGIDPEARGCGYWSWKPAVILETINRLGVASLAFNLSGPNYITYADSGVEFIAPVSHIIERMNQDIFLFGNNWEHAHWCKRDIIEEIWPSWERGRMLDMSGDREVFVFSRFHNDNQEQHWINVRELAWERFHKQVQASVIFFRVSDYTRQFVAEWLKWCLFEGGRLIDDSPSRAPNHEQFRENRHDQSILTTMAYREGLRLHYWPAVYNRGGSPEFVYEKLTEYANDTYPVLFSHHRKRDNEWSD